MAREIPFGWYTVEFSESGKIISVHRLRAAAMYNANKIAKRSRKYVNVVKYAGGGFAQGIIWSSSGGMG